MERVIFCENDIEFGLVPLSKLAEECLEGSISWKSWQNTLGRQQLLQITGSLKLALDSLQELLNLKFINTLKQFRRESLNTPKVR